MQTCHLDLIHIYKARLKELKWETSINIQEEKLQCVVTVDRKVDTSVK